MRGTGVLAAAMAAALLGGCAGQTGPVVGDWRGRAPTLDPYHDQSVELILDGPPGAVSGTYHLVTQSMDSDLSGRPDRFLRWADQWERRDYTDIAGRLYPAIHLHDSPGGQLADYALLSNGTLLPIANPLRPDLSANAMRLALAPVPRGTYGYGRP